MEWIERRVGENKYSVAGKSHTSLSRTLFVWVVVLSFFSAVGGSFGQSDKPLEKVRLQLKWVHQFQFAGYYAAVEKGFYRDAGLDVELIEGEVGVDFVAEVLEGRAEYGTESPYLLIERNKAKPIVVLGAIFQHSPHILLLRKDTGINTPQQLRGRRVMMRVDSSAEICAMFINEGVELEDIELVEHTWKIEDLIDGKVDASVGYLTDEPFELESKGVPPAVINPITYGIDFYGDCLFTSEEETAKHPDRVKAFRSASLKGWDYAMSNPDEIIDIIISKYNPDVSKNHLRQEWAAMTELMLPDLVEAGHMNPGRWKHIGDTFVKLGMLDGDYSLDGFLYDPDPHPDYTWLNWLAGTVGVTALVLFLFSLHLRRAVRLGTLELSNTNRELEAANQQLSASGQQLMAANQQLRSGEQQLRAANQQLQSNEQRYRAIVEDQTELICRNLPDFTLTYVNEAYCRCFGQTADDLVGKNFLLFIPGQYHSPIKEYFSSFSKSNPVATHEHKVTTMDGSIRWHIWTNRAIFDKSGNIVEFQGVGRDITEQRNAEREREVLLKTLAAKNKELQSIVYTASHDLKSPLVNIKGFSGELEAACGELTNLLEGQIGDQNRKVQIDLLLNESVPECLKFISAGTDKMKVLLDGLLRVSRVGSAEMTIEKIDMDHLLKSVVNTMQYQIADGETAICIEPLPECVGDHQLTNQVFSNLIDNALKYLHPERKGEITISGYNEDGMSVFCVSDNGIGIHAGHQQNVFEIFHRLDPEGPIVGEGLGLTIVSRILDRLNGTVRVESEPDEGTKFFISLPKA